MAPKIMKPSFDSLLTQYREREIPPLPASFSQDVLRAIRQRQSVSKRSWWQDFVEAALQPAHLVAGLALAMVIGTLSSYSSQNLFETKADRGIDLAVFSSSAHSLPSGLLTRRP